MKNGRTTSKFTSLMPFDPNETEGFVRKNNTLRCTLNSVHSADFIDDEPSQVSYEEDSFVNEGHVFALSMSLFPHISHDIICIDIVRILKKSVVFGHLYKFLRL